MSLPRLLRGALVVAGAVLATAGPLVPSSAGHALPTGETSAAAAATGVSGHRAVGGPATAAALRGAFPTVVASSAVSPSAVSPSAVSPSAISPSADAPALAATRRSAASALVAGGLAAENALSNGAT